MSWKPTPGSARTWTCRRCRAGRLLDRGPIASPNGSATSHPPTLASARRAGLRLTGTLARVRVGRGLVEHDVARQHLPLPLLVLGVTLVELGHHLVGEQLEAGTDVLMGVPAG